MADLCHKHEVGYDTSYKPREKAKDHPRRNSCECLPCKQAMTADQGH